MTVWVRIALYLIAGWLYGSGYIGDEVKGLITTDPQIVATIEAGISLLFTLIPVVWWRLAQRFGWKT